MAQLKDSLITGDLRVTGTIYGNATSANKLSTARTINGTSFDGTANITTANWGTARTVSISSTAGTTGTSVNGSGNVSLIVPSTMTGFSSITSTTFVGALTGHASSDLALTGGTLSGDLLFSNPGATAIRQIRLQCADNDYGRIAVGGTASNSGYMEIATADDASEPIYVRQYSGVYTTLNTTLTLLDASHNTTIPGRLTMSGGQAINQILTGTGTAASDGGASASPNRYKPAKWTFNTGRAVVDGDIYTIKIPVAGHSYGVFMSVNNGTNYYPVVLNGTGRLTTHYPVNNYITVIFESSGSAADMYALDGADSRATVTGGVFRIINYYDSNSNTIPATSVATAAATAAKVGDHSYYALRSNSYTLVTMRYANTAASALTLNINGTGAKPIYINGAASSASNYTLPAGTYIVFYNGTNYYFRTDAGIQGGTWFGNASTASKLATARSLKVALGSTTDVTFDGTADQTSIPVSGTLPIANGGTGATSASAAWTALGGGASGKHADSYFALASHGFHVPSNGTSNSGKVLKAKATDGSFEWGTLSKSDVGLGNVANTTITVTSSSVSDGTNTFNKYTHPTTTAVTAAAVKVGKDSTGHVVIGDALTAADVGAATSGHNHDGDYVNVTGDTMTGNLAIQKASGTTALDLQRTDVPRGLRVAVGSGGTNIGLYDLQLSKWIIYSDGTDAKTELKLYGAVWNDFAEFRQGENNPGKVMVENGDDSVSISTKRLQPGSMICSDTFGFAIGETDECKCPIAVAGRVLAYPLEPREQYNFFIGQAVCSGPNGTVSIMTKDEVKEYPECVIGYVSAVPKYEEWGTGKVKVDGRIWIKVK